MDDKETSCEGSNFGDFRSVDEVVRFYKLPNRKTKTSIQGQGQLILEVGLPMSKF